MKDLVILLTILGCSSGPVLASSDASRIPSDTIVESQPIQTASAQLSPATGACCDQWGFCSVRTEETCTDPGVVWIPDGVCDPYPCPPGACCTEDGSCQQLTRYECYDGAINGVFLGIQIACGPNPCTPFEACCNENGDCTFYPADYCIEEGGSPQGGSTSCLPNICPQPIYGACCFADGSCLVRFQSECVGLGGTGWTEAGTCVPNLCVAIGACCLGDNPAHCTRMTQTDCANQLGLYVGDNTFCNPDPCPGTPTRVTTWGRIKAVSR